MRSSYHILADDPLCLRMYLYGRYGGLIYGFAPNRSWCDSTKYFWVQAETFASAALLYNATGDPAFVERFVDLWKYQWNHCE